MAGESDLTNNGNLDSLCRPAQWHLIRAAFSDGAIKEIDLSDLLRRGGVFEPIWGSRSRFEAVRVSPESATVEWPGEVDLDAEVLYGRFEPASGATIRRRTVRESVVS